jgi:uncharacterized protein (DUF4415 family)
MDHDVIAWLKSYGRSYRTKANLNLRHAMQASNAAASERS